ncbi:hypothetical protein ACS0TY_004125 [Phlomoides rotata]
MERADGFGRDRVEYIYNKRVAFNGSSISEAEIMDVVSNSDSSRRGNVRASRMEQLDDYNSYARGSHSRASYEMHVNRPEYVNFQGEEVSNSLRSRTPTNHWGSISEGSASYHSPAIGGSGYSMNSYYEMVRYSNHDLDSFENLENNRVELLRKLDELDDQLSRSCDMTDLPKGRTTSSHGVNRQPPDDMSSRYASQAPGFTPFTNRHDPYFSGPYLQRGHPDESVSYADTNQQEMSRRSPHQPQSQYTHSPYHEQVQACFCVHCCNRNSYMPPNVDPSGSYNRRSQNENSSYSPGGFSLHPSHSRQSPSLDSENYGFNHNHPGYVVETHRGQVWHPIAGGAPIIACFNCFEVLKLPRKHLPLAKTQHKLKCGACSSVILLKLGNGGSAVPDSGHFDQVSTEIEDASSLITHENARYQHAGSNSADMNAFCNDYDHEKKLISGDSEKQVDRLSEDEQNTETFASGKHGSPSSEHVMTVESFPHPRLSSEECLDHSSDNIVINEFDKGNKSKRFDLDQNTPSQNYVEDSAVATEISLNSGVSQDFVDQSEERHPMVTRNSSRHFTESSQVFVNGHLIPEQLVQKAEKLAGPIQPGEYWYDAHAGFWGVMGYPCLGIIMPNIEEFSYPMPENCGAGNTGVFVNGRELHQKDLAVLAGRGLPDAKHGSYLVQISGKVVDYHTGEELHSLGRLAPTVERAKRGFGMKVPSFIARLQS